jgi:kynurenine formamidase
MSLASRFPYEIVDLTHTLSSAIPTWDGSCGFNHAVHHDYDRAAEYQFRTHKIGMSEGIGTHMDSPAHCIVSGKTIDQLPVADLCVPCAMIDMSDRSHAGYSVSAQDVRGFEKEHGSIQQGSLALFRTGWERFWDEPEKYRNNHLFPSVSADAAELLLERGVAGLGLDTLSPDRPENGFPVHKLVLGAGKFIIENAFNLSSLPPQGSFVMALPLKIKDGTEAPVRLIGLKP